jgi:hypothetical protein
VNRPSSHNHELKLERATEHLSTLQDQIDEWIDATYRYVAELDPRSGKKHIFVQVLNAPPAAFRPIIGDCLHNLRSALDNLAYELAVAHHKCALPEPFHRKSEFPILRTRLAAYTQRRKYLFKRLQPYQRGAKYWVHPLWQLHHLNNLDKHRFPHVVQFATVAGAYFPDSPRRPSDLEINMGPLRDGMRVATYTPPPDEPAEEIAPISPSFRDYSLQKSPIR